MEHDSARELLAEAATGRLDAGTAAAVQAHASACDECALTLRLAGTLQRAVREQGPGFLTTHPTSTALASRALAAEEQDPSARAAIDAHVAICPACAEDLAHARAMASAPLQAPVLAGPSRWRATMPLAAAAVAVLALSLPAYRGLVELPRVQHEQQTETQRLTADNQRLADQLRQRNTTPPAGGASRLLFLSDPVRGDGGTTPTLRPTPGASVVPVVIAADLTQGGSVSPRAAITVRVSRDGSEVWRTDTHLDAIWDDGAHIASLLVPAAVLAPATYELHVTTATGTTLYRTAFVIAP